MSLQASDGEGDTQTDAEVEIALEKAVELEDTFVEYTEAEQAARAVAYAFTSLTVNEWKLVQRLMRGEKMCEVARTLNVTKVAISLRVKALVEKHPAFEFLRAGWRP